VLSPSTAHRDRNGKHTYYQQIETAEAYVLIEPGRVLIELFERRANWAERVLTSAQDVLSLSAIDVALPVSEIYRGIS